MRHVDLTGLTAPQKWADRAAKELEKLHEDAEDADKELVFRELWREDAIRDRLIALIGEKCWYCETRFVRSPFHVDHYRPKSVVVGEAERRGYWWLAYDPANYRLACHHCNSGGARYGNKSAGAGKGARFPYSGHARRRARAWTANCRCCLIPWWPRTPNSWGSTGRATLGGGPSGRTPTTR